MATVTKIEYVNTTIPTRKKVAAYARVSVDSQELLESLSAQISYYSEYIQSNPTWQYAGVYADAGISGTSIKSRSDFQQLIADCKAGKIDIVLTKSISRFARNTVDLLRTIRSLKERHISVRFERENLDSLSPDGELMLSILASYAQEESRSISENVKWGIRKRFSRGEFLAYNIYGYRWVYDHFEIINKEAEAIQFMYQSFADGMLLTEISEALTNRGIFTRNGKPFGKSSIMRILDQEKYRGFSILQRTFTANHITHEKKINRGDLPRFVVEGTHPRIISEELHHRVETERERRRQIGVVRWRRGTCFTGKLICGYCGHTFTYTPCTKKSELTRFQQGAYKCSYRRKHGAESCSSKNLPVYTLRQLCCKVLGPKDCDDKNTPFDPTWVEEQVHQIVVFADTLEFHLLTGSIVTTPWKNTAKRDLWAYRRQLADMAKQIHSTHQK